MERIEQPEYSKLSKIYDSIMEEVNYESWADFIDELIQIYHPHPIQLLELACGTGSLSLSLDELQCYEIMATDKSSDMIDVAKQKAHKSGTSVQFEVMDFLDIRLNRTFDVVICIFDSINYLQQPEDIRRMLSEVKKVLSSESLFIFDFTTPRNSLKAINYLDKEEGFTQNNYHFFRKSRYDARKRIHYNEFDIEKWDRNHQSVLKRYTEIHRQRIYTLNEMMKIINQTDFEVVAKYEDFDLIEATDKSLRITMVLQCL